MLKFGITVALLGMSVVFFGLIFLILIINCIRWSVNIIQGANVDEGIIKPLAAIPKDFEEDEEIAAVITGAAVYLFSSAKAVGPLE